MNPAAIAPHLRTLADLLETLPAGVAFRSIALAHGPGDTAILCVMLMPPSAAECLALAQRLSGQDDPPQTMGESYVLKVDCLHISISRY